MPRFVVPPARGLWKQVRRAQSLGFAKGMAGRGGHWYALGLGAWGLLRLRSMSVERTEIVLSEPLGPGEEITISHRTTTRAEFAKEQKQAQRAAKARRRRGAEPEPTRRRRRRRRRRAR